MSANPFDFARFLIALEVTYKTALTEVKLGQKRTHRMWFIYPQLRGLGSSPTAQKYGMSSRDEARA